MDSYDQDYYENGILTGKSCFENYRWIPELTIPMAMVIIDYLGIKRRETVLDFGCAKGFLVKAFRWLGRQSFGVDVSEYALANVDPEVSFCCKPHLGYSVFPSQFDCIIAKDVFEHIPEDDLAKILQEKLPGRSLFVVLPLGDEGHFRAPSNDDDITHINCMPEEWWSIFFHRCGWDVKQFTHRINGVKDKYYEKYPKSHGFYLMEPRV